MLCINHVRAETTHEFRCTDLFSYRRMSLQIDDRSCKHEKPGERFSQDARELRSRKIPAIGSAAGEAPRERVGNRAENVGEVGWSTVLDAAENSADADGVAALVDSADGCGDLRSKCLQVRLARGTASKMAEWVEDLLAGGLEAQVHDGASLISQQNIANSLRLCLREEVRSGIVVGAMISRTQKLILEVSVNIGADAVWAHWAAVFDPRSVGGVRENVAV